MENEVEFIASVADVVAEESVTLHAGLEWYERGFVLPNFRFDAKNQETGRKTIREKVQGCCKLCSNRKLVMGQNTVTTNFRDHIKLYHRAEYVKIENEEVVLSFLTLLFIILLYFFIIIYHFLYFYELILILFFIISGILI